MSGRIVVIDGEDEAAALETMLRRDGYEVKRAERGEAGLQLVSNFEADVVLVEQRLPDMDEMQVLTAIQRLRPEAVVVFMSAHVSLQRAILMVKLGAEDYLAKPLDTDEVRAVVRRAVEKPRTPATIHRFEPAGTAPRTRIPGSTLRDLEREAILRTLDAVSGSTSKAAAMLGISARKIQYKVKEYREEDRSAPPLARAQ